MNAEMNNTGCTSLKMLLKSWGLINLLPHMEDENIGIEEMKMMKNHHIVELLHSYKLGTRIRFEYYFERWRRDQNKPLIDVVMPNYLHSTSSSLAYTTNLAHSTPQPVVASHKHKKMKTRATNTERALLTTISTNTLDMSVLDILNSSGFKGNSLLEYYHQHKQLTNVQRTLLIELIVSFFKSNNYRLSLKVSYNLEQQILKLFPSEKLEYYRTEKRGKIYVKLFNMRRPKRGRPSLKRKCREAVGDYDKSGDGGKMLPEPYVRNECSDGDMNEFMENFEYCNAEQSSNRVKEKTELPSDSDCW